jgi:D-serine deaminase-like pyridoxal phosphate-dependent protein
MLIGDLPTPQVLVDHRRLVRNIDRAQRLADAAGMRLRPHAKTHKSPVISKWQIERGAVGICCAKLGEAEVFAEAGIEQIRLPYPIHPHNAARLLSLMDRASISIIIDHLTVARGWSDAMYAGGRRLDVLVKIDVGFHRCGLDPTDHRVLDVVEQVSSMKGLRLCGLLSHAGHSYLASSDDELRSIAVREAEILTALRDRLIGAGVSVDELSVGATPTLRFSGQEHGVTELRPGNYVYFDRTQVALGSAALTECALTVLATVVSKPAADRIILDCGSKVLSSDLARGFTPVPGYGAVLTGDCGAFEEALVVERLSEEHATVRVRGHTPLEPGARVRVLPNHSCVVSNLVDQIRLIDDERVVETLPVAARGRIT